MFGAPNNWVVDKSAGLVKDIETDQYKAAVGYVRDLVQAGVMHPDSPTVASQTAYRDMFVAGKLATAVRRSATTGSTSGRADERRIRASITCWSIRPGTGRRQARDYLGAGYNSLAVLKPAAQDRIKEILRVMNWLAAPFGSQEDLLLTNGLAGTHYNLDPNGNPIATPAWNADVNNVPWRYVVQHPQVIYFPGAADFVQLEYDAGTGADTAGLSDPTLGLPLADE